MSTGNGDGSFGFVPEFATVDLYPVDRFAAVATADLNRDDRPDLVTADYGPAGLGIPKAGRGPRGNEAARRGRQWCASVGAQVLGFMGEPDRAFSRAGVLIVLAFGLVSCEDDGAMDNGTMNDCYDGECSTRNLPLVDGSDAPSLLEVKLECQDPEVVVLATATDPHGSANLQDVLQTIGVHSDKSCQGTTLTVQDDFVGVEIEESFGTVFTRLEIQRSTMRSAAAAAGRSRWRWSMPTATPRTAVGWRPWCVSDASAVGRAPGTRAR